MKKKHFVVNKIFLLFLFCGSLSVDKEQYYIVHNHQNT